VFVQEAAVSPLVGWESFYVIVGSSAGALTGLQFVVITLVSERGAARSMLEVRAFGTPTVVHFCAVLLISGILSAPWGALRGAAIGLGACAIAGVVYALTVIRRARRQSSYSPDKSDWVWYVTLPIVAYIALLLASVLVSSNPEPCLYVIAATALLLLFIGIHNAWDTVTWVTVARAETKDQK
jgi:hypothetical protein